MIDDVRAPNIRRRVVNKPIKRSPKFNLKLTLKILGAVIIALIALVLAYFLYHQLSAPSPVPKQIISSVSFPVYYPVELPSGYKINESSFNSNGRVVTYSLDNGSGKNIIISEQAMPNNFDFENFNKKRILGSKEILTPVGKATIGQSSERNVASVITDKTWVLVSAPSDTQANQLETIVRSLKQAK